MGRPWGIYINLECEECKSIFNKPKATIEEAIRKGYRIRFCSLMCRREYFKVNKRSRREIWSKYNNKQNVKNKKSLWHEKKKYDGNLSKLNKHCFLCLSKKDLVIHHRDGNNGYKNKLLNNNGNNLVILCRKCHPKIHNQYWLKSI